MLNATVLVPGFLGFEREGPFAYFADRASAALSGALTALEAPMPVIPITTLSIASLADRQIALLHALDQIGADCFHLVGHSTGGVDAELLTRREPLSLRRYDLWTRVRPRICTVVTLAAPLLGTTLAVSPPAQMIASRRPTFEGLAWSRELVEAAARHDIADRLAVLRGAARTGGGAAFAVRFFTQNALLSDLTPKAAWARYARNPRGDLDIEVQHYATTTPKTAATADPLFRLLWLLVQRREYVEGEDAPKSNLEVNCQRLSAADVDHFGRPDPVSLGSNDGVVNTARQILPGGRIAGLIDGDHGDVLGHYRWTDPFTWQVLNPGLLTSGAKFEDDTFFALYADIARTIQLRVLST